MVPTEGPTVAAEGPTVPAEGPALQGGAYINEGDARGRTALMAACRARYADPGERARMVRYLLRCGADPNIADAAGMTALMHACAERAGAAVAALLLEHGADPGARDYGGSSALLYAAQRGDRPTLQALLDACEARGREVIIITTATSPSGTKTTRQYLHAAPPSPTPQDPKVNPTETPWRTHRDTMGLQSDTAGYQSITMGTSQ
uniref:Uncharacterized protein n=1 Tax=Gallus gallus TaxID=9031 RepID=A0A8V1ALJ0_CHICK